MCCKGECYCCTVFEWWTFSYKFHAHTGLPLVLAHTSTVHFPLDVNLNVKTSHTEGALYIYFKTTSAVKQKAVSVDDWNI